MYDLRERENGGHIMSVKIGSFHLWTEAIGSVTVFQLGLLCISCRSHRVSGSFMSCQGRYLKGGNRCKWP